MEGSAGAEPGEAQVDHARLVDDYFRLHVITFGHLAPSGAVHVTDHAVLAHTGVPSVYNRGTALGFDQPDVTLREVAAFFGSLPHTLWLDAATMPDDADRLLRAQGYLPFSPQDGLVRTGHPPAIPAGLFPQLIADPREAPAVADVVAPNFGLGADDRLVFTEVVRAILRHSRPFQHGAVYGVRIGEELVGSGALLCTRDVAGVSWIATRPGFRGRGIATAVVARALSDAAALGYRVGVAVTNPDNRDLLASVGFEPVSSYCVYRQARP